MISLNPQYIKDAHVKDAMVVLTTEEFTQILEELEELEDIISYDKAKKGNLEFIEAAQAFSEIENNRAQMKTNVQSSH